MRTLLKLLVAVVLATITVCAAQAGDGPRTGVETAHAGVERFAGVWIFDAATYGGKSQLSRVWESKLTVAGGAFALSKFFGHPKDLKGRFTLDPAASPKTIDMHFEGFKLSEIGAQPENDFEACTIPGIFKLESDRLTICFDLESRAKRPRGFDAKGDRVVRLTFSKAPAGFREFPKEITLKTTGPDGKPAAGVMVTTSIIMFADWPGPDGAKPEWKFYQALKTTADGTLKLPYGKLGSGWCMLVVRDPERKQMAFATLSPANLLRGKFTVALQPECRVSGDVFCEELYAAGFAMGSLNVKLIVDGREVAYFASKHGRFEFIAPPGAYTVDAYTKELRDTFMPLTVPAGKAEFRADPLRMIASPLALLRGKPAPELTGVVAWHGAPVKFADLKGRYVLVDFWGYWCVPCVNAMPALIELHEKFADKGLAIIGVHVDLDGEVDTAAKLEPKIAGHKKKIWNGKDLPFPVALVSGKREGEDGANARGGAVAQYGIGSFPTTVLIDPEGKVVGEFTIRDAKYDVPRIEKLLKEKK
jgi:uncharacterized protein (TIGR03067 family)